MGMCYPDCKCEENQKKIIKEKITKHHMEIIKGNLNCFFLLSLKRVENLRKMSDKIIKERVWLLHHKDGKRYQMRNCCKVEIKNDL